MIRVSDILFPPQGDLPWQEQRAQAAAFAAASPGLDPEAALRLLHRTLTPVSGRWTYLVVGKAGSSGILGALHALEFGTPLSVHVADEINANAAGHNLVAARLLSPLATQADAAGRLSRALRLTSARHPVRRLVSAFRYLCRADARGAPQFLRERLLMSILCGFDWTRDRDTPDGFVRFLDFLLAAAASDGTLSLDLHLADQSAIIRPDIYRPDVVIRLEAADAALADIAARLDRPAPAPLALRNAQPSADLAALVRQPAAVGRLSQLCDADCARFGYDPDIDAPLHPFQSGHGPEKPAS